MLIFAVLKQCHPTNNTIKFAEYVAEPVGQVAKLVRYVARI